MKRIRETYGVPARRGMQVEFQGLPVVITAAARGSAHLLVRPVSGGKSFPIHPTWCVDYRPTPQDARPGVSDA